MTLDFVDLVEGAFALPVVLNGDWGMELRKKGQFEHYRILQN